MLFFWKTNRVQVMPAGNIGLAIWRLKCFYETFVQGSTAVILLNFSAKFPPHRQAEKRCKQWEQKFGEFKNLTQQMINFIFVEL